MIDLNVEVFKDIPDWEQYSISNIGRVYSKRTNRILSVRVSRNGYKNVILKNRGVQKCFYVHRLVAICFVENPNSYDIVNHKDGNKQNNHFSNLEWAIQKDNVIHAYENNLQLMGEKSLSKKDEDLIIEIQSYKRKWYV